MPKIRNTLPLILILITVAGCSSKPREVTASLPLVPTAQEKPNKKEIPQKYWEALADNTVQNLKHDTYQIQLGDSYISALGSLCRELVIFNGDSDDRNNTNEVSNNSAATEKRIACKMVYKDKESQMVFSWFLEKQIIESTSYVEL